MTTASLLRPAPAGPSITRYAPKAATPTRVSTPAVVTWLAGHLALGWGLAASSNAAATHAAVCLVAGLWALRRRSSVPSVLLVCGYVATSDVLWRIARAPIFWESAKYLVALLALAALVRLGRPPRGVWLVAVYFGLLLLSVPLTVEYFGVGERLREALGFNLSGPFALATAVWLVAAVPVRLVGLERLLFAIAGPVVATFAVAARGTTRATADDFANHANFLTSGGYGPNQVSSLLGLGAFCLVVAALHSRGVVRRAVIFAAAAALAVQALLTFSRGGAFNLVIALTLLGAHYLASPRARVAIVATVLLGGLIAVEVVFPRLDAFTGDQFSERFTNTSTTGREELAREELSLFRNNPLLGVGPGVSPHVRGFGRGIAAHTELTRLLAEHGVFGLLALVLLALFGIQRYRGARDPIHAGLIAAFAAWSFASMLHAGMRIASISFVFALVAMNFSPPPTARGAPAAPSRRRL